MATHSSVLAWRILGTGEPGGLLSMGSHRVGYDWSDLPAAAADSSQWGGHSSWGMSLVFPLHQLRIKATYFFSTLSLFLFLSGGQRKPRFWPPTNTRAQVQSLTKKLKFYKMDSLKTNKQKNLSCHKAFILTLKLKNSMSNKQKLGLWNHIYFHFNLHNLFWNFKAQHKGVFGSLHF